MQFQINSSISIHKCTVNFQSYLFTLTPEISKKMHRTISHHFSAPKNCAVKKRNKTDELTAGEETPKHVPMFK